MDIGTIQNDMILLTSVFSSLDKNGDGQIEYAEFEEFYKKNGLNVPAHAIKELFKEMDKNGDGTVDMLELMEHLPLSRKTKELYRAFHAIDENGDGTISIDELKTMMLRRGESATEEEIAQMMQAADTNGDGVISFMEFAAVLLDS